jgi:hypothetical protein
MQLFTAGSLELQQSGLAGLDFFEDVGEGYGIDEQDLGVDDDRVGRVSVPECTFVLEDSHLVQLQQLLNPVQNSDNYGIELCHCTVEFISTVISQNIYS